MLCTHIHHYMCFQRAATDQHRHCGHRLLGQPARRNIWQSLLAFSGQKCELLFCPSSLFVIHACRATAPAANCYSADNQALWLKRKWGSGTA